MATIVKYVDPDATGTGDGTSWANAYNSLSACESAHEQDLTAGGGSTFTVYCRSLNGTADGRAIFSGWQTSAVCNITIIGYDFPGDGVWDATKYRIAPVAGTSGLGINENYVTVIHIQASCASTPTEYTDTFANVGIDAGGSDIRYYGCIAKGGTNTGGHNHGWSVDDVDATVSLFNCIAYDYKFGTEVNFFGIVCDTAAVLNVYNCTVYNCWFGIRSLTNTTNCYNCAVGWCADDFSAGGGGTINVYNSCSDDGDGSNPQGPLSGDWSNEYINATGRDFDLKAGGNCINHGVDDPSSGKYADDIIGTTRVSTWDIGAYEYPAGAIEVLAGQSSATSSTSGALTVARTLALRTDLWQVVTTRFMTGQVSATASATGTLSTVGTVRALTGVVTVQSSASGTIKSTKKLAGVATAVTTVNGTARDLKRLAGISSAQSPSTGTIKNSKRLVGTSSSTTSIVGVLRRTRKLAGTSTTASSAVGALRCTKRLAGTIACTSGVSGIARSTKRLTGVVVVTTSLPLPLLRGKKPLAGLVQVQSVTSGAIAKVVLREYYNTGADAEFDIKAQWGYQTFITESSYTLHGVKLKLSKAGNPGVTTISLKNTNGNGKPTGGDLCVGTTNGSTLPSTPSSEWRMVWFTATLALTGGVKYAIVARAA